MLGTVWEISYDATAGVKYQIYDTEKSKFVDFDNKSLNYESKRLLLRTFLNFNHPSLRLPQNSVGSTNT